MTSTGADESPWNFERQSDETLKTTIRVGRNLWSLHGMTHRILETLGIAQSKALSMAERGPQDYAESDFERGMRAGARLPGANYGGTNHSPNGAGKLIAWILGVFGAASTLLLGLMLQSQYSLRADVSELKGQVSILVQDRNRGNNNGRSP